MKEKFFSYFFQDYNTRRLLDYLNYFDKNYPVLSYYLTIYIKGVTALTKQNLIETKSVYERLKMILEILDSKINDKITNNNFLNEQIVDVTIGKFNKEKNDLSIINSPNINNNQKSFNSKKNSDSVESLREQVTNSNMHEEAKELALNELQNIGKGLIMDPNQQWIINYVKTLLSLPWGIYSPEQNSLRITKEILDRDHYGLEKIKARIVEFISVKKVIGSTTKGSILCFNGPPGVGKTSLAKSIAESLGRVFCRLSLGGVRDESNIRGHRKTYIGSMPGNIIQTLKKAKVSNPLILLDEVDKLGVDTIKGDVESALLEVLDPEQNNSFRDHYLGTYYDLSKVFFICTSNFIERVSAPLRDRMEIIDLSGYTLKEKVEIAKRFLIPKQIKATGLDTLIEKFELNFSDLIIEFVIENYTFESGVRNLEKKISGICRFIVKEICEKNEKKNDKFENKVLNSNFKLSEEFVIKILGPIREKLKVSERMGIPGVAIVSNLL